MQKRSLITVTLPALIFALTHPCFAQSYAPSTTTPSAPPYALMRWDEDWSFLRDPAARTDFFDPVKYIPLNSTGDYYLSLGGQARYRFDYFNNPTFGPGTNDDDGFHLQRYLLHLDAHLGQYLRAFVQGDAAFVDGRTGGGRYGDADHGDLQQAFVDLKTPDASNPYAFLRLGRQELIYGAQRYVSPDDWRNVRRTFDGAKVSLSIPNDTLELFWVRPVVINPEEFNDDDPGSSFAGAYNVTALPHLFENARSRIETYFFALNQSPSSLPGATTTPGIDADTYTAGARFYTNPKPWDLDVEANYQFGDVPAGDLSAWSFASEAGYTFPSFTFTPRASVGLDAASGSRDGTGRFNQLFPPTYNYLGHLYLFGRPNLIDAHAGLDLHLTRDLTLYLAQHAFWRQDTNDGLYNLAGSTVRADNGSDARYVGAEFDVSLTWQISRHVSSYIGYAHFFAGDFINQTGPSQDVDFLYASVTFTF